MSSCKSDVASDAAWDWSWLLLLKAPGLALRGRVLLLAATAVLVVWAADQPLTAGWERQAASMSRVGGSIFAQSLLHVQEAYLLVAGPFIEVAGGEHVLINLVRCIVRLLVFGLVGGAIARIAALALTREEGPDPEGALRYAWSKRYGFIGGPLLMLLGLLALALPLVVARLAMQLSWVAAAMAVLWPVMIVAAVIATLYAVAVLIGWPLLGAAAATDGSDGFDAVSRTFAYIYQKPLRLGGYLAVLAVLFGGSALVGELLLAGVERASDYATAGVTSPWAIETIAEWTALAASLVGVYLVALLWTSAGAVYLLRRRDVDGVHLDEVYIDPAEFDGGLPSLTEGETGIPSVDKKSADAA